MALKGQRFDLDAARRALNIEPVEPRTFVFNGNTYTLVNEPSLGDALDLADAPEHVIGLNDTDTHRLLARFVRSMIEPDERLQWDDDLRRLKLSEVPALVQLVGWITETQSGFPTMPPDSSSDGREPSGSNSSESLDGATVLS